MSELQKRSMELFKKKGYIVGSVERRKTFPNPKARRCPACKQVAMLSIAHDLFNCFDFVAHRPIGRDGGPSRVYVQVTDRTSHSKHRNKILASAEAKLCLLSGMSLLLQSWRKVGNRWQAQDEWISKDQFCFGLAETAEQFYEDERRKKMPDLPAGSTLPLSDLSDESIPF